MKHTLLGVAFLLAGSMCGCSKFLEPKSQSEFSPTDVNQLNELIISALPEPSNNTTLMFTGGILDVLSDDIQSMQQFIAPTQDPNDAWYSQGYVNAVYGLYTWQPNYSRLSKDGGYRAYDDMYKDVYTKLVYANTVLDYADKVDGDNDMRAYVKAQALALRAFYYLHLVNMYGVPYNDDPDGPGIPIRTTGAMEVRAIERSTVGEVYALIESDLRTSVGLFETVGASMQFRQYRASMPMALLLLARTYLYMENWERAEFYADKLISEWPRFRMLSLKNDLIDHGYTNVDPKAANIDSNAETKCRQVLYNYLSYDNPEVIWLWGAANDATDLTAKSLDKTGTASASRLIRNGSYATLLLASPSLMDSYDPDDLRLRTYLVRNLFFEPNYDTSPFVPSQAKYYCAFGKMKPTQAGIKPETADGKSYGFALRIAEAYLILAEAQAMQPAKQAQALQTLTKIWDNRFDGGSAAAPASYTTGDVIELVRAERRRELCLESLRWFDMRRWGMKKAEHVWYDTKRGTRQVFTIEDKDPGFTLAMPPELLDKNTSLTQVPLYGNGSERLPAGL